jgi:hypothetical protein
MAKRGLIISTWRMFRLSLNGATGEVEPVRAFKSAEAAMVFLAKTTSVSTPAAVFLNLRPRRVLYVGPRYHFEETGPEDEFLDQGETLSQPDRVPVPERAARPLTS